MHTNLSNNNEATKMLKSKVIKLEQESKEKQDEVIRLQNKN